MYFFKSLSFKHTADTSTELGRAFERDRLQALSVASSLFARLLALAALILASRIALEDLGGDRFGVWVTIASFLSLVSFLDLGVGNGLIAPVAKAAANKDSAELRNLVTSGVALSLIIAACAGAILFVIASWLPVTALFRDLHPALESESRHALQCFAVLCSLWIPAQTVHRVLVGLQRAYITHIATALCSVITCALLIIFSGRALAVSHYILISFGVALLAAFPATVYLARHRYLRVPRSSDLVMSKVSGLLSTGGLFLALQFGGLVGWGMDQALISASIGAAAVAPYAIAVRIYLLVSQPLYVINAPLWSSYAHAIASGDRSYLRKKFFSSVVFTAGFSIAGVCLVLLLGHPLWALFTNSALEYSVGIMIALGIWTFLECTGNALAMLLNAAHVLREQLIVAAAVVLLALPAKVLLIAEFGSIAAPVVTITVYMLTVVVFYGFFFRKKLAEILRK